MANCGILTISAYLLAGATVVFSGQTAAKPLSAKYTIPEGYHRVAKEYGVPAEVLYLMSLVESSRPLPQGERPWPWTLNVAGKGYQYNTKGEAYQALLSFMRDFPLRRIDVGIAQVNLGWNGAFFHSYMEALDPYTNLRASAQILRHCYDINPGSWLQAAGCYHHPAGGKHARIYRDIVKSKLAMLDAALPGPITSYHFSHPVMISESPSTEETALLWVVPQTQGGH
ncbi:lytic transglycosylase domain-containing protein [Salmonella enterica]|nr:lytic transglycosylase domain-containing protein [Salmonella enterica]ECE0739799.1 lytic transglycosylase domain-containing protein [Salmonella enterica subsp. enterica serovar Hvittingfoss]HEC8060726.1 lytic transglycosylase domain-containing protein [Salmonella enterica subsp. enterica serovar Potsdam]EGA8119655.1 lytic transglycosylase domain-containing protein [Salmonella enterica]EHO8673573.1 lytic transglycosylase domain-containing protein [Salmonella enterica]